MTKIATATLAMRLAEEGVIELDEPVSPLVQQTKLLEPIEWADRITLRHLLQHSAGLRNPLPVRWVHPAAEASPGPRNFPQEALNPEQQAPAAAGIACELLEPRRSDSRGCADGA